MGTSSTRTGTSRPCFMSGMCKSAAVHSSVVYRSRSKYAAENSATTRPARSNASLIAVTKLRPAAQSHTSSSTVYPVSINCQATHSAQARSAPAWLMKKSTRSASTHPVSPSKGACADQADSLRPRRGRQACICRLRPGPGR
jgi:hypothetical protein